MAGVNACLQWPTTILSLAELALRRTGPSSTAFALFYRKKHVCSRRLLEKAPASGFPAQAAYTTRSPSSDRGTIVSVTDFGNQEPDGCPAATSEEVQLPDRWDVVGLGQAMVDFAGMVGDDFLLELGLEKGIRKIVNHEERGKVLRALDGCSFKASAGGSLSNTLVALARLGSARTDVPALRVAMTGSVGSDPLGGFYRAKLLKANVHFLSPPVVDGTTGTVIVLTTPDAQRTMLSYQGMSSVVNFDCTLDKVISSARILVVEGYLWEIPETIETITKACEAAQKSGVLVALTASDVSCVSRHRKQFWDLMASSADILFANSNEARAICGFGQDINPELMAHYLSKACPFVSVTDGASGSHIGVEGEVAYISPADCIPVDTCGAGDAYAAGILYSILNGMLDLKRMGNFAAKVAAVVVRQQGTRLRRRDALKLANSSTGDTVVESSSFCNILESD